METKLYSLEEVAKHNYKDGNKCWIVVKDNIYDVTEYLEEHPGGGELITEWAGKDGTRAFDEFGHSGDAKKDLKKYKIGELIEEDRKKKPNKKVDNGKVENGKQPKVVEASETVPKRGCLKIISCGLIG